MAKRSIIVASPQGNRAKTFETDVKTWGELKAVIGDLYSSGVEAVVNTTKATLQRDDASLPEGPFSIYLVTKNNKAGATTISSALYDAIDEAVDNSSIDKEDYEAVLGVVKSTINAFFQGAVAASAPSGPTQAELDALAEARRLGIR